MSGSEAFYRPDGADTYLPTAHTEGPWDPRYQHGGPPGALLARAVEEHLTGTGLVVARITMEILGPVPCRPVQVRARVERPGRRVQLVRAELRHEGRLLMTATAWAVRPAPAALPVGPTTARGPEPGPEAGRSMVPPPGTPWDCGFLAATEWRFVDGGYDRPGPAAAWVRARHPLLPDEPLSPMQRTVLTVDSANGMSAVLDIEKWMFVPPELTVHVLRPPDGEWLHLAAVTEVAPGCAGLTTGTLSDRHGPVARSAQALFVARQPEPPGR
ncbi:thioesterase family protein [Micromonospora sp. NBRC 101691]|uniref:thioesterase family protein n=1 Tax=Micromonospora sp. NBRC 101691 TaxID=3032198 RepID=UPI0024A21966|nr:thioesterase family protein [Micromonospora sp. NBRC 101691]GLY22284.1 hypothetical protein Misp04_20160 [Micromonospora sp. NBRC 101691]